jgi:hypothetical protein
VQAGHYRYKFCLDSKFLKYTKIKESILSSAKFRESYWILTTQSRVSKKNKGFRLVVFSYMQNCDSVTSHNPT